MEITKNMAGRDTVIQMQMRILLSLMKTKSLITEYHMVQGMANFMYTS